MKKVLSLFATLLMVTGYLACMTASANQAQAIEDEAIQRVKDDLQKVLATRQPNLNLVNPVVSGIPGILQMQIEDGPLVYVTNSGSHFFIGDVYKVKGNGFVNITEAAKKQARQQFFKAVSPDEYISFAPVGEVKSVINVFTDVTCGYCRRLHSEMDELNALGIEVRYFAFPRGGIQSPAYSDMVSAWCSDSPHSAISTLKAGGKIATKTCDNPVARHYSQGSAMGINGTPVIFFTDGTMIPGYKPARELAQILGIL